MKSSLTGHGEAPASLQFTPRYGTLGEGQVSPADDERAPAAGSHREGENPQSPDLLFMEASYVRLAMPAGPRKVEPKCARAFPRGHQHIHNT